jgi:hypothetical protein
MHILALTKARLVEICMQARHIAIAKRNQRKGVTISKFHLGIIKSATRKEASTWQSGLQRYWINVWLNHKLWHQIVCFQFC